MAAPMVDSKHMKEESCESEIDSELDISDDGFDADEEDLIKDALREDGDDSSEEQNSTDTHDNNSTDTHDNNSTDTHDNKHGLANVLTKILQKKVPSNKVILAKALTDRQIEKKKLEAEEAEDGVKNNETVEGIERNFYKLHHEKLKQRENLCHVKPDPLDKNKERQLQRIATRFVYNRISIADLKRYIAFEHCRGVVQLFNAVRKQQRVVTVEVKKVKTEKKKEQVLADMNKHQFLDILKGTSSRNAKMGPPEKKKIKTEIKEETEVEDKKWNILRDDYMMGAKMKDWNKSSSENEDDSAPDISDSD